MLDELKKLMSQISKKTLEKLEVEKQINKEKFFLKRKERDIQIAIAVGDIVAKNAEQRKAVIEKETEKELLEIFELEQKLLEKNTELTVLENQKYYLSKEIQIDLKERDEKITTLQNNTAYMQLEVAKEKLGE